MLSPNSPIADFYPENFEVDAPKNVPEWLQIILLPFIGKASNNDSN